MDIGCCIVANVTIIDQPQATVNHSNFDRLSLNDRCSLVFSVTSFTLVVGCSESESSCLVFQDKSKVETRTRTWMGQGA